MIARKTGEVGLKTSEAPAASVPLWQFLNALTIGVQIDLKVSEVDLKVSEVGLKTSEVPAAQE